MTLQKLATIGIATILLITVGCAGKDVIPKKEQSFKQYDHIVDANFVSKHITMPMDKNVMIIDTRPQVTKYNKGHIPMATNLPHAKFTKMADLLPKDKDALLIYYGEDSKCPLSHKSAFSAKKLGYTNNLLYCDIQNLLNHEFSNSKNYSSNMGR